MDDRARHFEAARRDLTPQWSAARSTRLFAATLQLRRKRELRRAVGYASAMFVAAALLGVGVQRMSGLHVGEAVAGRSSAPTAHMLRLADGSSATLLGAQSELEAVQDAPDRIALKLLAGRAHFEVVPNPERRFVVEVPPYRVTVIGTVFDVERSGGGVAVDVMRGQVRVDGPEGSVDLRAGQRKRFVPPSHSATAAAQSRTAAEVPSPRTRAPEPGPDASREREREPRARQRPAADPPVRGHDSVPPARDQDPTPRAREARADRVVEDSDESWRSLSRSGQYEAAFESLRRGEPVAEDPAALMDAADAARLSGHAQNAVQYLTRVARNHRRSPLAPLAAFTLGRVYLEELGQPELAAEAFELTRKLAPAGSMAQDALAREVEALSKAGHARKAYQRAQEYIERYPAGRRLRAVQLYGGLQ